MAIDDEIRSIENRLGVLDQERSKLLTDLKNLRSQRDSQKPAVLLGRPTVIIKNFLHSTHQLLHHTYVELLPSELMQYVKMTHVHSWPVTSMSRGSDLAPV